MESELKSHEGLLLSWFPRKSAIWQRGSCVQRFLPLQFCLKQKSQNCCVWQGCQRIRSVEESASGWWLEKSDTSWWNHHVMWAHPRYCRKLESERILLMVLQKSHRQGITRSARKSETKKLKHRRDCIASMFEVQIRPLLQPGLLTCPLAWTQDRVRQRHTSSHA